MAAGLFSKEQFYRDNLILSHITKSAGKRSHIAELQEAGSSCFLMETREIWRKTIHIESWAYPQFCIDVSRTISHILLQMKWKSIRFYNLQESLVTSC